MDVLTAMHWPLGALLLGAAGLVWLVPGFCWLALTCCQWAATFRHQVNQAPPLGGGSLPRPRASQARRRLAASIPDLGRMAVRV